MAAVSEHTREIDDLPVFWYSAPAPGTPILYLHGVPTSADDWTEFLARGGGIAVDLPGFGRSGKRGDFDYSIPGYDRFLERFLDVLGEPRVRLVMHDWGGVGLAFAQRLPERVERMVLVNLVPFLPGYRWHRVARLWRTRGLGELAMGATTRTGLRLLSREANTAPGPMSDEFIDRVIAYFDHGTQRAILRLYRSAPEEVLAAAGADLGACQAPTLIVWGDRDPYIPPSFADAYGKALPHATVEHVADAGHWPWIDRPELIDRIVSFAAG
ncbi:MAG TPA: alpha/beta hydrolase [Solirubrobacteraceae bacterium]|nr:alpha/beta hydrolase [Solirubrobacteraceae bacterium]